MAINKESNGYTFAFAISLVVVVGTLLVIIASWAKPFKDANDEVKKKMDIVKAILPMDEANKINRSNAVENFNKYVDTTKAFVINVKGEIIEGMYDQKGNVVEGTAFDVDIKKEFRDKLRKEEHRNFPIFMGEIDGETVYVMPAVGKGLWGPVWGNICVGEDMQTIKGATFDHKTETPGLGAEIKQAFFIKRWIGEKISDVDGNFAKFEVVKDGSGAALESKVDGITGGTITSKGVEEMVNRCIQPYIEYFKTLKQTASYE